MPQEKKLAGDLLGGSEDPQEQEKPKAVPLPAPIEISEAQMRNRSRSTEDGPVDTRGVGEKIGTTVTRGVVKGLVTEPLDMIGDVGEAVGFGEGFNDFFDAPDNFIDAKLPEVQGTGWQIAEGLIQFTAPFLATAPLAAATKATKAAQAVRAGAAGTKLAEVKAAGGVAGTAVKVGEFTAEASLRGAAVDFSSFDPRETGLAELAATTNIPGLKDLGEALSVHDTDAALTGRLKRTGEGAVLGVTIDAVAYGIRGAFRARMATRMDEAIKQGHATPSDVIKRDLQLAEAGHGTDPAGAQVTHMVNKDATKRMTVSEVADGWSFGGKTYKTIDEAIKAGKKIGLREETLREAAERYGKAAFEDLTAAQKAVDIGPKVKQAAYRNKTTGEIKEGPIHGAIQGIDDLKKWTSGFTLEDGTFRTRKQIDQMRKKHPSAKDVDKRASETVSENLWDRHGKPHNPDIAADNPFRTEDVAERDTKEIIEKLLGDPEELTPKQKIAASKITPQVVESFTRKVEDISKALDHADPEQLPKAVQKLIDDLHMNWKHYQSRPGDVAAPMLLLQKLVKRATLKDPQLKLKVDKWMKTADLSHSARAQILTLQKAGEHDMAFTVLTSEAVFTGQARYVSDITARVREAVETGADEVTLGALRKEQKAAMLDQVRLQKEFQDYVGNIGRGLRANQLREQVAEMVQKGATQDEIDEFIKAAEVEADEFVGEAFPTIPFKSAEEWIGAMDDVELQGLAELIEISGKAPNFAAIIKQARVRRGSEAGNLWDAAMEWQVAGLLSGPRTHLKILASNIAVGFNEAVWANALGSNMKGLSKADRASMRLQAKSNLYGLFAYAQDGLIAAQTSWKHNLPTSDPYTVRNVVTGKKGEVMRTPFRIINFMDTYSKVVLAKQQARTMALEKALKGGADFDAAVEYAERMATAAIDKSTGIILFEPGRKLGNKVAMMSPMNEGEMAKSLSKLVHDIPALQPFVKFIRPANSLMAYAAEIAPEAVGKRISKRIRTELTHGGPQARARMQAKRYTAYTSLVLMTAYYAGGNVTAGGPQDPALRETWLETHRPYSVKVGERWLNYNWIPGIGIAASMYFSALEVGSAELTKTQQAYSNTGIADVATTTTLAMVKAMMEQSYLQGFVSFVELLGAQTPKEASRSFADLTRGFFFAPLTQAFAFDPVYRDAINAVENVKSRIPGLSRTVPPRYDAYGRPLQSAYATPIGGADPTKLTQPVDQPDDLTEAMAELNVGFEAPSRLYKNKEQFDLHSTSWMGKGHDLTPWERFNQILREGNGNLPPLREKLIEVTHKPQFRAVIDEDFRKREMAAGRISELEYAQTKKVLHSALLKVRQGYYQAGYGILQNEYPKLKSELKLLIEADATGAADFM